jgi:8-oxo-dGTP diphosphatase
MKQYVVGLMFRRDLTEVALIWKKRPDWQRGKLNGPGGKIEEGELPIDAVVREFREETGFDQERWDQFCRIMWDGGFVSYYTCCNDNASLTTTTDEEIDWVKVSDLPSLPMIPDMRWVVPLAIAYHLRPFHAQVVFYSDPAVKFIKQ